MENRGVGGYKNLLIASIAVALFVGSFVFSEVFLVPTSKEFVPPWLVKGTSLKYDLSFSGTAQGVKVNGSGSALYQVEEVSENLVQIRRTVSIRLSDGRGDQSSDTYFVSSRSRNVVGAEGGKTTLWVDPRVRTGDKVVLTENPFNVEGLEAVKSAETLFKTWRLSLTSPGTLQIRELFWFDADSGVRVRSTRELRDAVTGNYILAETSLSEYKLEGSPGGILNLLPRLALPLLVAGALGGGITGAYLLTRRGGGA